MSFTFLKSTRFWAIVIIALLGVLVQQGIFSAEVAQALITILGGYTVIRTIDRHGEQVGK